MIAINYLLVIVMASGDAALLPFDTLGECNEARVELQRQVPDAALACYAKVEQA